MKTWVVLIVAILSAYITSGAAVEYAPLPKSKEGLHPVQMPEYDGVEQLLLLSNQWVIIVTLNIKEVLENVDALSKGEFNKVVDKWEKSLLTSHWDWTAKAISENLYRQNAAEARTQAGEFDLDTPEYYQISSLNDITYAHPVHPTKVTRAIESLGKGRLPGEYHVHYAQYSYLELPAPMQTGKRYTIQLKNGKKVSFTFDELSLVSRAIKINQVGYLPSSKHKYAYLGAYLQEFGPLDCSHAKEFQVISVDTGDTVLKGEIKLRAQNPPVARKPDSKEVSPQTMLLTGENTYELNLSGLTHEGEFFISIPGVGRSWSFRHAGDVYGEAFYIAVRGLYHQRCGIAIGQPYTAWPRIQCHTDPVYESEAIPFLPNMEPPKDYDLFNIIGATIDLQRPNDNATGGWHDAADWDRNIQHYANIFDLLNAYEIAPEKFYDAQLNIPESGEGRPDILDEAAYGLKVWKKSMDKRYGVSGLVETWTHPPIVDPAVKYAYSRRTRWGSLVYAAAAAQFAFLIKPFDPGLSEEYKQSALKAYQFGTTASNSLGELTIHAAQDRGKGAKYTYTWTEKDSDSTPYFIQASLRLFMLTNDPEYLKDIPTLLTKAPKPYEWPYSLRDFSPWLYFSLFSDALKDHLPIIEVQKWKAIYIKVADELLKSFPDEPYRQSWPTYQDYWMSWGNMTMTNQARCLLIAHHLTGLEKYKEAAILNVDYMLGTNPMGMCWTTGLGFTYPIEIQHAVSEDDGIPDPVPGITIYGNTEGMFHDLTTMVWESLPLAGRPKNF